MTDGGLALSSVTKAYGPRIVVRDVSFAVTPGERVALLGHNGAGKTTLMKMMLGLTDISSGEIRVFGHSPATLPAGLRRTIGFLPENVAFDPAMTGREMLGFYAGLKHRPGKEVAALLEQIGLSDAARRRIGTYSKGMRQRLGLAQCLLGAPRLLLLDEPTSGLDPELRQSFYAILAARAEAGAAVLLSSHLLTELEERTDRILIMDRGRLIASGSLEQLRRQAGCPVLIRATLADGAIIDRLCLPEHKLDVLRSLLARDDLRDVAVELPSLDAIYAHLISQAEAP